MDLTERINKLGIETAFLVGEECKAFHDKNGFSFPFHLGDVDLLPPEELRIAGANAYLTSKTRYTPTLGIKELREIVAKQFSERTKQEYTAENVIILPGGKPAIAFFMQAFVNPGQEVLYPNPGYPIYESQIRYAEGSPQPYPIVDTGSGFNIDLDNIEDLMTFNTRAIVLNNPHNPTGDILEEKELKNLAKICVKRNIYVLDDRAYAGLVYEGSDLDMASFPDMKEKTVTLGTLSKVYAVPGMRIGYAIGPTEAIEAFKKLATNIHSCPATPGQLAGLAAMRGCSNDALKIKELLRRRRDLTVKLLNKIPGFRAYRPKGAFYAFPRVDEAMEQTRIRDLEEFRRKVSQDTGVFFCTRNHFGTPDASETANYARFSFSGINETEIERGLSKLADYMSKK